MDNPYFHSADAAIAIADDAGHDTTVARAILALTYEVKQLRESLTTSGDMLASGLREDLAGIINAMPG